MALRTKEFTQISILVIIGGIFLWNMFVPNSVSSNANLQDSSNSIADSPAALKPGEAVDYAPSPFPDAPILNDVSVMQSGQPIPIKPRPSQEELEKLMNRSFPPDTPYRVSVDLDFFMHDSKNAAATSNTIVLASVLMVHPSLWTTADGKRPPNPFDFEHPTSIYTLIDVQIKDKYKGNVQKGDILTLYANGGQVGEEWLEVMDYRYKLSDGQIVLLYLDPLDKDPMRLDSIPQNVWRVNERYDVDLTTDRASAPSAPSDVPEVRTLHELLTEIDSFVVLK